MGRWTVLSDQKREDAARLLAEGNSYASVAKKLRIAKTTLIRNFSDRTEKLKTLANTAAAVEREIERLPKTDQKGVRSAIQALVSIQEDLTETAAMGAEAGRIVQKKVLDQVRILPDRPTPDDLKPIIAGSETVKSLLAPATSLIAANRGKDPDAGTMTLSDLLGGDK